MQKTYLSIDLKLVTLSLLRLIRSRCALCFALQEDKFSTVKTLTFCFDPTKRARSTDKPKGRKVPSPFKDNGPQVSSVSQLVIFFLLHECSIL